MIHMLAKEYGWSKSQIDEIYPDEASIYLKIIGYEHKDKMIEEKLNYYQKNIDAIYIEHGDPEATRKRFVQTLSELQKISIKIVSNSENPVGDDDLPDLDALHRLKDFKTKGK